MTTINPYWRRFGWYALWVLASVMLVIDIVEVLLAVIVDREYLILVAGAVPILFWLWIFLGCFRRLKRDQLGKHDNDG